MKSSEPDDEREDDPAVDARHEIVRHDSPAAGQPFELTSGPGFDDIEGAKEHEPGQESAEETCAREHEGDELPGYLVDDDLARVFAPEVARGFIRRPDAS